MPVPGWLRRRRRRLCLSQRFLLTACLIVAVAMFCLGKLIEYELSTNITAGVATTAVAGIDSMIADELREIGPERPLTPASRAELDSIFSIINDSETNKLLQIRIRNLDGSVFYESFGGISDDGNPAPGVEAARHGVVTSRLADLPLLPVGPLASGSLAVLKVVTPLHDLDTQAINATAELYYSAKSLTQLLRQAEMGGWAAIGVIGAVVIAALYLLVDRTSRTIAHQRDRLARNLAESRRLSEENIALRAASERLRHHANLANERLLAQVGSDLHDGPLQLLTLLILKLSRPAGHRSGSKPGVAMPEVELASQAMEELRNISSGLVLPELSGATLQQTLDFAVQRHEELTGVRAKTRFERLPDLAPMDVKVCAYRIVREGLTNAYLHSSDPAPLVRATGTDGTLAIDVTNHSPSQHEVRDREEGHKLGLQGMRLRTEALGGTVDFEIGPDGIARLGVRIPSGGTAIQA